MWFKLVIQSRVGGPGQAASERSYDQDTVTIGRGTTNDLLLKDPQRVVSSRHAEIRRSGQGFCLVDMGSTNGTLINGQRITSKKEYPLKDGDQLGVGQFVLHFHPQLPVAVSKAVPPVQGKSPSAVRRPLGGGEELVRRLQVAVREASHQSVGEQEEMVADILRQAVQGLGRSEALQLLDVVEANFSKQAGRRSEPPPVPPPKPMVVAPGGSDAAQVAYEGLVKIAQKYLKGLEVPVTSAGIEQFIQRIDRILEVTVGCVADAIKGRRQFEREFEVEATRILSWTPNPIKLAEGAQEIGEYLLNSRNEMATLEKMASDLEGVFRDLALHQLGLVAGFRECLRGLLEQLNPESFEAEARGTQLRVGPFKAPGRFPGRLQSVAWQRFKEKYQKLSEEEVRVFENILAPHFAKGYLSIQRKKGSR